MKQEQPGLLVLVFGALLGLGIFFGGTHWAATFDPSAVGLGVNTTTAGAAWHGNTIAERGGDAAGIDAAWTGYATAGRTRALWLGASQTHAINALKEGDKLAVEVANEASAARDGNTRYALLSEPNGNLHELWGILADMLRRAPPDVVVLALTYDDLREPGVRPSLRPLYAQAPVDPTALEVSAAAASTAPVADESPQMKLEAILDDQLRALFPFYASRDRVRNKLWATFRRGFATLVFRVVRRPQERIPQARAAWNMRALDRIEAELQARAIPLVVYKAPHQPGLEPFYHPRKAYDAYFKALQARIERNPKNRYLDLETLVPPGHWGMTNAGQPDAFHFTTVGHRLLGHAVDDALAKMGY